MGTPAQVKIYDRGQVIANIYQHYDGYDMGKTLNDFINSKQLVDGMPAGGSGEYFNGIDCFAAQFVAHIKDGAGNVYLVGPDVDIRAKFEFEVRMIDNKIVVDRV